MLLQKLQDIETQIRTLEIKKAALHEENEKREQVISGWEAEHEVRNVVGKFSIYYSAGEYSKAFELFSCTDQVYLQISDQGIYEGRKAVKACFEQLTKTAVPGSFRYMPVTSEIVEVSKDLKTAQGMWFINGCAAIKDSEDPLVPAADLWLEDKLAVELIRENGRWAILRMNINEEMRAEYHKSWGDYAEDPSYPDFDRYAEPTRGATRHHPFRADRKSGKNLTTPEPYAGYNDLADHY